MLSKQFSRGERGLGRDPSHFAKVYCMVSFVARRRKSVPRHLGRNRIRVDDGDVAGTRVETAKLELTENLFTAAGQRAAQFNPRSEFATSLPVFGCCARGTAKRLRKMALVGETCLECDKRNRFLAK